ncbi:MAG TPA: CotH kinase family protein, partial [Candidatus Limnocylindria bacterium]|nr:CotH kinase family protein [Candidatus Limnocylindria bacterium]
ASVAPGLPRAKGTLAVLDLNGGRGSLVTSPEYLGDAEFEIFGQTSAGFPKQPFNIELQDVLGNDVEESLLGMPADADWKLRNPYTDKPLMMDFLAYELFDEMGHYSVRRKFVEVFIDTGGGKVSYPGDYYGVLVFLEKIEQGGDRVNIEKLTPAHTNAPAISGGYMFKKDKDSVGDLNFSTVGAGGFPGELLKVHEPKPREITPQQLTWLTSYLNQMEQALYAPTWLTATGTNHYSYYLDPDAFVDQFWIVEFPKQIDGYRLSNYFQKDRNGRVKPAPIWDWNLSFGNANYLDGGHTNGWYYNQLAAVDHIWARRLITGALGGTGVGDPDFNQKIADRWAVLRTDIMNGPRLLGRIDQLAEMLNEAAARDFAKFPRLGQYIWPNPDGGFNGDPIPTRAWDVNYQSPGTYAGVVAEMKKWVMGRYLWVDSQFARSPSISLADGMVTNGTTVTLSSPDGGTIYYTVNGVDPRAPGGGVAAGALVYSGPITVNANVRIVARTQKPGTFQNTWSGPTASSLFISLPGLRITEIMYHPAPPPLGSTNTAGDFEFIEVKNISGMPLDVTGYHLTGGVEFTFPATVLTAGQSAVIVKNIAAFQSRYGTSLTILGTFTGNLSDTGDHLVLQGSLLEPIQDFSFSDDWNRVTDGLGFSLVVVNENAPLANYGLATNWRASSALGGSPGAVDPAAPVIPGIVINELMARPSAGGFDTVELFNPTASAVNIGGWFLSDDFATPRKFVIPVGTTIPANGFITFNETAFNVGVNAFAFGAKSDDVYLYAADGVNLLGWVHGFSFEESPLQGSYGRHVISTGAEQFVIQASATLGAVNSGPALSPVVISEIMYHPPEAVIGTNGFNNVEDEFIELQNISASAVPLYDPSYPTNQWRLRGGVDFDFPPNVTLPAGGYALIVGFDPVAYPAALAEFRALYSVPPTVPVFGPWSGDLDNDGDS